MQLADLPNRRVEAWKYSDLRAALGDALPPLAPAPTAAPPEGRMFAALAPLEIAFENGRIAYWPEDEPQLSSKGDPGAPRHGDCIPVGRLAAELTPDDWMPIVEAGETPRPVWLRVIGSTTPVTSHMRLGVVVPAGRTLDLIETYEGDAPGFTNLLVEAFVSQGGGLRRIVLQRAGAQAVQVSTAQVNLAGGARFSQFILAEGAKMARFETHVNVDGEGADIELNGAYLAGAGRHADLTSVITHAAAGSTTRQLIKGVARKGGRGVFQGKIVVAPHAQKTDARQYHHGILLEDGAEIFAKPELMIHADDVQCAHGNTAGGLDERALFYMRARGLPEAEARALLIESFLVEAIPQGLPEAVNEELVGRIRAWLAGGGR